MKTKLSTSILLGIIFILTANISFAQEQKETTPEEMAAKEATRLEKELGLEPHQTFYVDSILQHDMRGLKDDFDYLRTSGKTEPTLYEMVRKKWLDKVDSAYVKLFTPEQYQKYLKMTGRYKKPKKAKRHKK